MDKKLIRKRMHDLEILINYSFNKIENLENAMNATKLTNTKGKNNRQWQNNALATVGDAILKAIIAIELYDEKKSDRESITKKKESIENNEALYKLCNNLGVINFAYNDKHFYDDENMPEHEKVSNSKHNQYIEAIVAAIYFDSNFVKTFEWVNNWLVAKIEKMNEKNEN